MAKTSPDRLAKIAAWQEAHPERTAANKRASTARHTEAIRERHTAMRHATRDAVIAGYGGACACCGEDQPLFLTIDHIDGKKAAGHTKKHVGFKLYALLLREGLPDGYRVLCYNCNSGRERNGGVCPHEQHLKAVG